jgi:hypothetical protein
MEVPMTMRHSIDQRAPVQDTGAVVWLDERQARITTETTDGCAMVEWLDRGMAETESCFDARIVDTVRGLDPVAVSGPADSRLAFQRVFVALTHRPELLVDLDVDASQLTGPEATAPSLRRLLL